MFFTAVREFLALQKERHRPSWPTSNRVCVARNARQECYACTVGWVRSAVSLFRRQASTSYSFALVPLVVLSLCFVDVVGPQGVPFFPFRFVLFR